ncbi:MAG TPA: glycosyltransferase [Magnetospirillaceae bacterium]|jgi:glycosyltransferase involved in cell wall biosynthesis
MTDAVRSILIFEPESEGHPIEWLQHLVRYAANEDQRCITYMIVASSVRRILIQDPVALAEGHIRVVAMTAREQRLCKHKSLLISAFSRWWTMRRYMKQTGASAGYFLGIDHLMLPLALGFGIGRRAIGGILFRPSNHYAALGMARRRLIECIKDLRKDIIYRLALRNRHVHSIQTLDPYFPDYAARHYHHGNKVRWLPDPVHPAVNVNIGENGLVESIPANLTVLLLFGHITERKGALIVLDALRHLRPEVAKTTGIIFAGRVEETLRERFENGLSALAAARPEVWVHVEDRRIGSGELYALVDRSDLILAPYQRFVGSSGVLLWAARAGKPIVTQEFGLLGRLVRDNHLGFTADTSDEQSLCNCIESALSVDQTGHFDGQTAAKFVAPMTPQRFADDIFRSLLVA